MVKEHVYMVKVVKNYKMIFERFATLLTNSNKPGALGRKVRHILNCYSKDILGPLIADHQDMLLGPETAVSSAQAEINITEELEVNISLANFGILTHLQNEETHLQSEAIVKNKEEDTSSLQDC